MERRRFPQAAPRIAWAALASGAFLALAAGLTGGSVRALPVYAQATGLSCGRCHVNPQGGGSRTAFGRAFAANGHRLPSGRGRRHRNSPAPRDGCPSGVTSGCPPQGGHGPGMMNGYGPGPGMMGW